MAVVTRKSRELELEAGYGEAQHSEMYVQVFLEFLKLQFPVNLEHISVQQLLSVWAEFKRRTPRLP